MTNSYFIPQTPSTSTLLRELARKNQLEEGFMIHTDFQLAGKGQAGNSWESEIAQNLLFSILLYPHHVAIEAQFILSQLVSVAIKKVLDRYCSDITVKWPNDIYWKDKKLAGILIESSLQGAKISSMVIGVGLNVNQIRFLSDAPNPVSLRQITGEEIERATLLAEIYQEIMVHYLDFETPQIRSEYARSLYRKDAPHLFNDGEATFEATLQGVEPDGRLLLETAKKELRTFYFKEISFVI